MTRPAPPKTTIALVHRTLAVGAFTMLLGVAGLWVGVLPIGLLGLGLGGVFFWSAFLTRSSAMGAEALNHAWDATSRGRLHEAQAFLSPMEGTYQLGYIRQAIDLCLSRIAFRRGDLPAALRHADAAAGRSLGVVGRSYARVGQVNARALRAVIRAAMGDAAGAREDAEAVRASPEAWPEAVARAELAEAIVLEKTDRGALGAHLARHAPLLGEHTTPRERAIVRAYERLVEARKGSVYREAAPRDATAAPADEPTVEDWISTLAPAAAPFARVGRRSAERPVEGTPATGVDPALQRAAEARLTAKASSGRGRMARLFGLWVLLIMVFLAIWQFLSPADAGRAPIEEAPEQIAVDLTWLTWAMPTVFLFVIGGLFAFLLSGADRQANRVIAALRRRARGEGEEADRELEALVKSRFPLVASRAHLELAFTAERRGDFAGALERCDRGLASATATPNVRAITSSALLPELLAERALVLAAAGRDAEAEAEMAHLGSAFPGFPFLARAERRFGVLTRARRGDLAGAADLASDDTCDAPIPARDELLGDLARIAARPEAARPDEVARIERTLKNDPEAQRWIEAAAPAALAAFAGRERRAAPEGEDAPGAGADAEAEREALAEEEALGTAGAVRR